VGWFGGWGVRLKELYKNFDKKGGGGSNECRKMNAYGEERKTTVIEIYRCYRQVTEKARSIYFLKLQKLQRLTKGEKVRNHNRRNFSKEELPRKKTYPFGEDAEEETRRERRVGEQKESGNELRIGTDHGEGKGARLEDVGGWAV